MGHINFMDINHTNATVVYGNVKDRVCRFCGILRKIGIVQELKVHFWNAIHQIEGNYLLFNMNEKMLYPNLNF